MNRNLVIALIVALALGIAAYLVFGRNRSPAPAQPTAGNASAAARPTAPVRLPDTARPPSDQTGSGAPVNAATPLERARSTAMASLQGTLTERMAACAPPGAAPPRPRQLRFVLEWRPEASTPEMQQYMITDVTIIGGNAEDISPPVKACIDQLRGMPVTVFVKADAIGTEDRTMDATFEIPLP